MRRLSPPEVSRWLAGPALFPEDPAWGGRAWILHAMYENPERPSSLTYDDLERMEWGGGVPADPLPPEAAALLAGSHLIGATLGRTRWPGPGWRRLRWAELGARLGVDPLAAGPPSFRSFPYRSWPLSIAPPGEGSLDREQFLRLVGHLAACEPEGLGASCCAYYDMLFSEGGTFQGYYAGALGELVALYDDEDLPGSPTKVWPPDRSWFFHTDWDQWGTTVCGHAALMQRLVDDSELETRVVRP